MKDGLYTANEVAEIIADLFGDTCACNFNMIRKRPTVDAEETYGWLSEHNGLFSVTHWMPLPQPPKGGGNDER